ncbi:MAG TPA: hypothetical protein PK951_13525 [Chitinophagaceae bacterium]|nr:hypothetical protein [Chitinophagaceae bacterium]HUM65192.1 hypothetical protein [Chitinophagaceae bacterium]
MLKFLERCIKNQRVDDRLKPESAFYKKSGTKLAYYRGVLKRPGVERIFFKLNIPYFSSRVLFLIHFITATYTFKLSG